MYPRYYPEIISSVIHSGKTVISATPAPLVETDTSMRSDKLTMLRAIYENESHPHQPRSAIGLASLTFDIQRLMKDVLKDSTKYFDTRIYDGKTENDGKILYKSPYRNDSNPLFYENRILEVGERPWIIAIRSLPEFENRINKEGPLITAITGGLVSIFLTFLIGTLIRNHAQVIRVAENEHLMSEKLEEALRDLSLYNESVNEHTIISVTDVNGRILEANEQFYKTTQYTRDEIIGKTHRIFKS